MLKSNLHKQGLVALLAELLGFRVGHHVGLTSACSVMYSARAPKDTMLQSVP